MLFSFTAIGSCAPDVPCHDNSRTVFVTGGVDSSRQADPCVSGLLCGGVHLRAPQTVYDRAQARRLGKG
eukprot:13921878-Alexandrium_andersonii.AAC.1